MSKALQAVSFGARTYRRAGVRASRLRPVRSHEGRHDRRHVDGHRLREPARLSLFRRHDGRRQGAADALRDARRDRAAPLGLVQGNVRRRQARRRRPAIRIATIPASCYIETLKLDETTFERYQQLTTATQGPTANRPARLASGEPNVFGDWAQEQYLIARPPDGRGGLVPKSMVAGVESGQIAFADVPNAGWGARPVTFTPAGQAEADALRAKPPEDSPRARAARSRAFCSIGCSTARSTASRRATAPSRMQYGRGLTRTIHMNMSAHPAGITPSRGGPLDRPVGRRHPRRRHVGFAPGIIAGTVSHSAQLHVVERFTLDPATMALKRDYIAEDPVNVHGSVRRLGHRHAGRRSVRRGSLRGADVPQLLAEKRSRAASNAPQRASAAACAR